MLSYDTQMGEIVVETSGSVVSVVIDAPPVNAREAARSVIEKRAPVFKGR